jgi:dimeric dUTPase (all-alpha-NTP-PPase superfamily)
MKAILQIFALVVVFSTPTFVVAQEADFKISTTPTVVGSRFKSQLIPINLDIVPKWSLKNQTTLFSQHLPLEIGLDIRTSYIEESHIIYNMPVVKLEKTSKILLKELDPDFPYSYSMPIKKLEQTK